MRKWKPGCGAPATPEYAFATLSPIDAMDSVTEGDAGRLGPDTLFRNFFWNIGGVRQLRIPEYSAEYRWSRERSKYSYLEYLEYSGYSVFRTVLYCRFRISPTRTVPNPFTRR